MSTNTVDDKRKVTTMRLTEMKARGEKIAMLTAYDYSMAKLIDEAGMDVILVGDSASNVMAGNITTLPITLDQMIYHAKSVIKGERRALVVCDMPFGTYQGQLKEALASAIRIMKESHAEAVKMEGGAEIRESIERILCAGIPVMGHSRPHTSVNQQVRHIRSACQREAEAEKLTCRRAHARRNRMFRPRSRKDTGSARSQSGVGSSQSPLSASVPAVVSTARWLVMHDMLGINQGFSPKFLRRYADLSTVINSAVGHYIDDVKTADFPNASEQY